MSGREPERSEVQHVPVASASSGPPPVAIWLSLLSAAGNQAIGGLHAALLAPARALAPPMPFVLP